MDGNHHWLEDCVPPIEEIDADDDSRDDPHHMKARELGLEVILACKHCDAISDDWELEDE